MSSLSHRKSKRSVKSPESAGENRRSAATLGWTLLCSKNISPVQCVYLMKQYQHKTIWPPVKFDYHGIVGLSLLQGHVHNESA